MPFTLSHAAAAYPIRRARLSFSALIFGTFAPDLEYFLRLRPGGGYGHTIPGAFDFSLPMGLVALVIFHQFIKTPLTILAPPALQRRLVPYLKPFPLLPLRRFALIVLSILIGIGTHILWDSFTHNRSWVFNDWPLLHQQVPVPHLYTLSRGSMPVFKFLQFISSVAGLAFLAFWCLHWYRRAPQSSEPLPIRFSAKQRWACLTLILVLATTAGILRGLYHPHLPWGLGGLGSFIGGALVTFGAALWWQLVLLGFFIHNPHQDSSQTSSESTSLSV